MLEKYRVTMHEDILRAWAQNAQEKIDAMRSILELVLVLSKDLNTEQEAAKFLRDIEAALNL